MVRAVFRRYKQETCAKDTQRCGCRDRVEVLDAKRDNLLVFMVDRYLEQIA